MENNVIRTLLKSSLVLLVLLCGAVYAEAEFDFEQLMEAVDNNTHNIQGNIATKDANGAIALAKDLQNEFKLVENFFAKRGNAQDAVTDAKRYQDWSADIIKAIQANDFQTAANKAVDMGRACDEACHDTYKPL